MSLTPADIQAQSFRVVFRGYDVNEVDSFLDRIEQELAQPAAPATPVDVTPPAGADPAAPDDASAPEAAATGPGRASGEEGATPRALRTLLRAEQMADQMLADAATEAAQVRAAAQTEAETILGSARVEAARLEGELRSRRQREQDALSARAEQLQAEVNRLTEVERRSREALRAWLARHERLLEESPVAVPSTEAATVLTAPRGAPPPDGRTDPVLPSAAAS